MLALLRQWGFEPQNDLTLVELGINDKSLEALRQGELDAALLPPEKAFLAEEEGSTIVADSSSLNCHWVPLATTRKFLQSNREVVGEVARIYRDSIRIFLSEPERALHVVQRHLPGLARKPHLVERVCRFFASQFEPTLVPDLNSLEAMLGEIARQDPRARDIPLTSLTADLLSNGTNA